VLFTGSTRRFVRLGAMKLQLVALFTLAAYIILTSAFTGLMLGVVPTPGP